MTFIEATVISAAVVSISELAADIARWYRGSNEDKIK